MLMRGAPLGLSAAVALGAAACGGSAGPSQASVAAGAKQTIVFAE